MQTSRSKHTRGREWLGVTKVLTVDFASQSTGRDTFFFDADVYFRRDPYPHLNLVDYDLIMSENIVFAHGNTGFTFQRSTPSTINLYESVLALNMIKISRDQVRTNDILGSYGGRRIEHANGTESFQSDFTSANPDFPLTNGIRVHILNSELFYHFHFSMHPSFVEDRVVSSFPSFSLRDDPHLTLCSIVSPSHVRIRGGRRTNQSDLSRPVVRLRIRY